MRLQLYRGAALFLCTGTKQWSTMMKRQTQFGLLVLLLIVSTPLIAADGCKPVDAAVLKLASTPTHLFEVVTEQAQGGKSREVESIYIKDETFLKVHGSWIRSNVKPSAMFADMKEARAETKILCSYLHDEDVNGEAAALYHAHSETDDDKTDQQIWISKRSGLILKSETDTDVGGQLGKTHRSLRYEYNNVQAPKL